MFNSKFLYSKAILCVTFFALSFFLVFAAIKSIAGEIKKYPALSANPTYSIEDDSFSISGATEIKNMSQDYWLVFSSGQPAGYKLLTDLYNNSKYEVEGGYISGIESVFTLTKTLYLVESPSGFPGTSGSVAPGARITYKLNFVNDGEAADTGSVVILDPLPSTLGSTGTVAFNMAGATSSDYSCEFTATDTVHCLVQNVAAGATGTVTYQAVVK